MFWLYSLVDLWQCGWFCLSSAFAVFQISHPVTFTALSFYNKRSTVVGIAGVVLAKMASPLGLIDVG
ncbi:hypothetical protein KYX88_15740, partial [Enterococcus faecium]|nr:hypothetical protein [Enterococcus faecium]